MNVLANVYWEVYDLRHRRIATSKTHRYEDIPHRGQIKSFRVGWPECPKTMWTLFPKKMQKGHHLIFRKRTEIDTDGSRPRQFIIAGFPSPFNAIISVLYPDGSHRHDALGSPTLHDINYREEELECLMVT